MMEIWGRASRVSASISPAWFMPSSNTPKRTSFGILASDSGTPQWLLNDLAEAWTEPLGPSARRKASLVPVLPALPVTAITLVLLARARAARPRPFKASSVSPTRTRRCSSACGKVLSTMAQAAPFSRAPATKACPSRFGPRIATKASAGASERLSIEQPNAGVAAAPSVVPRAAFAISPRVQSGSATGRLLLQRRGHCVMVREGDHFRAHGLAGLVAFAGHEQDIAALKTGNCLGNRSRTVADLERSGRVRQNLTPDFRGAFAARIVVGDNGAIGFRHRDLSHLGALAPVAIAAAAEHDDEPLLDIGAQGVERFCEG